MSTTFPPEAAIASAIDYKLMMSKNYASPEDENQAYSECHTRSAQRVLKALLANGGACSTAFHDFKRLITLGRHLHQIGATHGVIDSFASRMDKYHERSSGQVRPKLLRRPASIVPKRYGNSVGGIV